MVGFVAALSLAGCTDDVGTSGNSEVNVKDTKANQDPKTRALHPGSRLSDQLAGNYDWNLIRFPELRGVTAEELPPRAMDRSTEGVTKASLNPAIAPAPF